MDEKECLSKLSPFLFWDIDMSQASMGDHIRKKIAWIPQELALPSEWVSEMVLTLSYVPDA